MVEEAINRYDRQEMIEGWDQSKLQNAKIGIVGAGHIGNFLSASFAALGVGDIRIYDDERTDYELTGMDYNEREFLLSKMSLEIAVVYGSVRSNRQGIKAARFIVNQLKSRGHAPTLVDPLKYKLPLLDKMYKEYSKGKAPKNLEKLSKIFTQSDAVIVVSAEYNHTIPPALSNILDHFMKEYFFKPSGIVTYSAGTFGGVRAAMTLRVLLPEIGMPTIPTTFPISKVQSSFDDSGKDLTGDYERRIKKFLDELEWYANAMKAARKKGLPY